MRVLDNTGATVRAREMMYTAVAQLVLLYRNESWVVTGEMLNLLERFHHQAASRIKGMTETRGAGGEWEYPLVVVALEDAGLYPIMEYISRRKATIAEKVACHPIYELLVEAERRPGMSHRMIWWEQDVVNQPEE